MTVLVKQYSVELGTDPGVHVGAKHCQEMSYAQLLALQINTAYA